jgi:hypothetical protein
MSNLYRELPIDASYQVSVHLAKWFQRKRFLEINQSETRIDCGNGQLKKFLFLVTAAILNVERSCRTQF